MPTQGPRGRFIKGGPGGPGRPKGVTLADKLRKSIPEQDIAQLVETVMRQALDGCTQSQRMLLDRVWPVRDATTAELVEQLETLQQRIEEQDQCRAA